MMKNIIRIDGDACPSINLIENLARKYNFQTIIYANYAHNIVSDYSKVVMVDKSSQSADIKIINETKQNDIIVTQDYGLASIIISKKAFAINPKGLIYTEQNIDKLLFERHLNSELRQATGKNKGPKKRSEEDNINLIDNLEKLIIKLVEN